ncbi:hypothetical protein [Streptomyces sp. MST-110588]|uniref:hypothetical protein n=1 Tax=Streptomyces sp. MST-110588 TaxID=2833628 RepID=UPI003241DBE4
MSIAWNHSGGWTVSCFFKSARTSAIGVFLGMPYFHIAAALMMQRMLTTLPNWLSFQSWKVLSNMAMPVALSGRGYGFWPKTTTFHLCGGLGLSAWKVSSRTGTTSGPRPGPMNVAASGCASMTGFSSGSHGSPPPLNRSVKASGSFGSFTSFGSGWAGVVASLIGEGLRMIKPH